MGQAGAKFKTKKVLSNKDRRQIQHLMTEIDNLFMEYRSDIFKNRYDIYYDLEIKVNENNN